MLREEILAVEFTPLATGAETTHPGVQVQMLRLNMALPFILAGEGGRAAGEGEDACVWPRVRGGDVAGQGSGVFEWGEGRAGWTGKRTIVEGLVGIGVAGFAVVGGG